MIILTNIYHTWVWAKIKKIDCVKGFYICLILKGHDHEFGQILLFCFLYFISNAFLIIK